MTRLLKATVLMALLMVISACTTTPEKPVNPQTTPAVVNAKLGLHYLQQGNLDEALIKLQRSLTFNPDQPETHHYLAELYRQLKNDEKAEIHYAKAIKLMSNDANVRNNYGVFLCERGRYELAEEQFLLSVRTAPNQKKPFDAYENIGFCAQQNDDFIKAEKYFRMALDLNPNLYNSLYSMAEISFSQMKYLRARAFIQRYFSISAYTPQSLRLGIKIEKALGDHETVGRYLTILSDQFPANKSSQTQRSVTN